MLLHERLAKLAEPVTIVLAVIRAYFGVLIILSTDLPATSLTPLEAFLESGSASGTYLVHNVFLDVQQPSTTRPEERDALLADPK